MVTVCIDCWHEVESDQQFCPNCGVKIDSGSASYQRLLFWALKHSRPDHRAEICRILGLRGSRAAVPHLLEVVNDYEVMVRVAALRALASIGDESAIPAIEKALCSESNVVRTAARDAQNEMNTRRREPSAAAD
jgi:HEAT repeat protein